MDRAALIVEGHGEVRAAGALVGRLWRDLELDPLAWDDRPLRGKGLATREGLQKACELIRPRARVGVAALLVLRDEDDACPRDTAPVTASWLHDLNLPFASAVVFLYREYEALFLPCLHLMAGRPLIDERGVQRAGLVPGASFTGNAEAFRNAKGQVSRHFPKGRAYKPTLDQLPLTRMIDFATLRASHLRCFGTLERALRFLSENRGVGRAVYPPPA